MANNLVSKLLYAGGLFILTIILALLPHYVKIPKRLLSALNVMAGGVFLASALCHLLPTSIEQFEKYFHHHDHDDHDHDDHDHDDDDHDHDDHDHDDHLTHGDGDEPFPWGPTMLGVGFLCTLFVERIAHGLSSSSSSSSSHDNKHDNDIDQQSSINALGNPDDNTTTANELNAPLSEHHHQHHRHHHHHHHDEHHGHSHLPINTPSNTSIVIFIAIWVALSFHSILEGIALGSSDSSKTMSLLIAIVAHKGLEAFALGTNLIKAKLSSVKTIIFALLYSAMTPIGISIGLAFTSDTSGLATAILTGFAAGTFFYVGAIEVIQPEMQTGKDTPIKCILLALGYAAMALVAIWA